MVGKIYPFSTLFISVQVGEADQGEKGYTLATQLDGSPLIVSAQTGKQWAIGWRELVVEAMLAGIDQEDSAEASHAE